jgi:hypothetical protein
MGEAKHEGVRRSSYAYGFTIKKKHLVTGPSQGTHPK